MGTIRVLLVDELPVARVIAIERHFTEERVSIDVPVVPLVTLLEFRVLGRAAAAPAERLMQRARG